MNLPRLFARGTSATGTTSQSRPRWHYLYYLLAAFDICAVCASLYLNQQMMRIYIDSVATDRTWVEIGHAAAQLGEAAASIDAPGNDVFRTRDFAGERENLRRAQDEFNAQVVRLRRMLSAEEQDETVRGLLEDVKTSGDTTAQMVRSAVLTFAYLADNQLEQATTHMATMDRFYASVHSTLVRMRSRISDLQEAQFSKQVAAAASLQKAEYLIVGMISLMVFGATAYGRLIARQVSVEANLKEAYRAELEQRIKERTADLTAVNEVRAQLLKSLLSAQEDERRRMARDLHDGVGQSLTYLVVSLRRLESARNDAVQSSQELSQVAAQTLEEVRLLARGLRPTILDDLGLDPALARLVSDCNSTQGIAARYHSTLPVERRLPETVETTVYRIVQEALANIVKHSAATAADVELAAGEDVVTVQIRDNGRGFNTRESLTSGGRSVGLSSMRERASILGGTTEINSEPGRGTIVTVVIPLPDPADPHMLSSDLSRRIE